MPTRAAAEVIGGGRAVGADPVVLALSCYAGLSRGVGTPPVIDVRLDDPHIAVLVRSRLTVAVTVTHPKEQSYLPGNP